MPTLTHHHFPSRAHDARRSHTSQLALRARVMLHAHRLDVMLLDGADPAQSPELAVRARQLTSQSFRQRLAEGIEHVLSVAERRISPVSTAPPLAKHEIIAARAALIGLVQILKEERSVAPAGVVLIEQLLTNGLSPLYVEERPDDLWRAVRRATAALESGSQTGSTRGPELDCQAS